MTYASSLSAFEGEVIPEVASFKEEGFVTPKGWDWEKGKYMVFIKVTYYYRALYWMVNTEYE